MTANHRPSVAILVGPTAVGKTRVALELAGRIGAEMVNADSLQVYRELNIGTAKPTLKERALVPHHLIDVAHPPEPFDAARYQREGRAILAALHARGTPPLVVGGTGLYIKALLYGLFEEGREDPQLRRRLRRELTEGGLAALFARLQELDPATAARLSPSDTYRTLRALEVLAATGKPLSQHFAGHGFRDSPYRVLKLGLTRPREELYRRIEARVEAMLAQGWLEEVKELLARYPADLKPLRALGYRHLINYLEGRWSLEEAVALIKRDTRRYAKRQLTWFRGDPEVQWFEPGQIEDMAARLAGFF
ncbi:MAG: tRNA (adenosine(37)-N6)-dimethylallyltransferase MiaA [Deltaproteobacteria bacterium]|nr:tRNA (adenosine(37)-N6)-dimethylallyltransferase MiaA [Deltaproteobacteria bacterium]